MARGRFVVFEGIDGSGKSTTLARVARALGPRWPDLVVTREETEGPTGNWVRSSIAAGMEPLATAYLFLADRAQHVPSLRADLAAGRHVLCDRYMHSTLAYQSVTLARTLSDPTSFLRALHGPIELEPDHVLLFRADPSRCVDRTRARGGTTAYEKVAFLEKVQAAYLRLAEGDPRFTIVNAEQDLENLVGEATDIVSGWLDNGR